MCQNKVLLKQFTGPFAFLASFQLVFSSLSEIFPERKKLNVVDVLEGCVYKWKKPSAAYKMLLFMRQGNAPNRPGLTFERKSIARRVCATTKPPFLDIGVRFVLKFCCKVTSFICWLLCLSLSPLDLLPLLTMEENLPGQRGPSSPHLWTLPEVVGPFSPPSEKYMIYIWYIIYYMYFRYIFFPIYWWPHSSQNFTRRCRPSSTSLSPWQTSPIHANPFTISTSPIIFL